FTSFDDAWSSFVVRAEPLERFYDQFLPHMTVAVTRTDHEPGPLRDVLARMRGTDLGNPDRQRSEAGAVPGCAIDAVPALGGRRDGVSRRARAVARRRRSRERARRATRRRAR